MGRLAVLQADGIADLLGHTDFLACTIDELELAVRKENGQRDAWETTTCAEVENLTASTETNDLGNRHGVEHVMLIEVVDIFSRDDVDLLVPVAVEGIEGFYLTTLLGCQVGKVFADEWLHGQNE